MMKKCLLLLSFIIFWQSSFSLPKIFVFHINGVNTTQMEARANEEVLEKTANINSNMLSNSGHFDLLYNKEESSAFCSLCNQLVDTLKQKKAEHKDITIDDFVVAYLRANNLDYKIGTPDYEIVKAGIKDDYLKDPSFVGANLEDIYNQFRNRIQPNLKFKYLLDFLKNNNEELPYVLLIPHSQGNLYANQFYDYVIKTDVLPKDHLAIYGIADPVSKIDGTIEPPKNRETEQPDPSDNAHYTTADNDFVIHSLSIFSDISPVTNKPLPSNVHLNTCGDADICHSLTKAYLMDDDVSKQIKKQINLFIISLKDKLIYAGIQDHTIRFLYLNPTSIDVELLDPSKRSVCSSTNCNKQLFYYLFTGDEFDDPYDIFSGPEYLATSDKFAAGNYLLLLNSGSGESIILIGNITSGYTYFPRCDYEDKNCSSNRKEWSINTMDNYNFLGMGGSMPDKNYSNNIPEIYYNGKFIMGGFMAN